MSETTRGVAAAVVDSLLWAATALYWPLLDSSADSEILGHRLVWALVLMGLIVAVAGRAGAFRELLGRGRSLALLVGAAGAITANWAGFIWGVNHGHVVEASLGFFINPLMTVLLGVVVLGERLRPWQLASVGLAVVAVLVVTVEYGELPWYALMLAVTGGLYGLFKKQAAAGPFESLALETAVVAPFALVFLLWQAGQGQSTFVTDSIGHTALLVGGGLVTVTPLMFYGYAALRVPLVTLGVINYLAPVATFLLGILYFREPMEPVEWAGYALIWLALVLFTLDGLRAGTRRAAALEEGVPATAA